METERINVNPLQPRREFDQIKLQELAASIRAYGVLQPLVVYRVEKEVPTGAVVEYELIAGERRLRASKLAGIDQVPVVIRKEPPEKIKLEMALVENIQREDLNPMERAEAYRKLMNEFGMTQRMIAERIGKSREAVANVVRLVGLPDYIKEALRGGRITEGHARPLLMLSTRAEEQQKLFEEILFKNISVRHAEQTARRIATDRIRRRDDLIGDPEAKKLEEKLSDVFGTRVFIEQRGNQGGGRVAIDFFSLEDLYAMLARFDKQEEIKTQTADIKADILEDSPETVSGETVSGETASGRESSHATEEDLKNFTI